VGRKRWAQPFDRFRLAPATTSGFKPTLPLVINERFSVPATEDRVPYISLVLREMWDTTVLDAQFHRLSLGAHPTEPQLVD
jgi:hypothetical protein